MDETFDFNKILSYSMKTEPYNNHINICAIGIYSPFFNNGEPYLMIKRGIPNDKFIKFILEAIPDKSIIFSHDLDYDGRFILDYCEHNNIEYEIKTIKGRIIRIIILLKKDDKKIKLIFRDNHVLLGYSLEALTEGFEAQHKKLKLDYDIGIDDPRFKQYFENDLIGLYEVLEKENNYGLLEKDTFDLNVISVYKKENPEINFEKCDPIIDEGIRESYYSRRKERFWAFSPFKKGFNILYYYKFNSLYPYVMWKYEYPLPIKVNLEYAEKYDPSKLSICFVCVKTPPNLKIPVLPYRTEEGEMIFPTGEFCGFYTSSEINLALSQGYKIDFIGIFQFEKTGYIFRNWVDKHYQKKMNTPNHLMEAIETSILNSLYKIFIQKPVTEHLKEISKEEFFNNTELKHYVKIGPHYYELIEKEDKYPDFIHSEIASFITANARVELYNMMLKAGLDNVYSCNTDYMVTSKKLPDEYVDDKTLGKMRLGRIIQPD